MTDPTTAPDRRSRLLVSVAIGLAAGLLALLTIKDPGTGGDFTFWWRGARAVLAGQDPYEVIRPIGPYPYNAIFPYPLTAAVATIPFAWLSDRTGAALFVGCGFALAAYGLQGEGRWRLIAFAGAPTWIVLLNGQWAPLLLGAALVPPFGFLLAAKPTIGAAYFLWRPSWRAFVGGLLLVAVTFALQPTWPADWLGALAAHADGDQYRPPLLMHGGFLLPLAVLRWRRPEARLLALLACVPQNASFYDQLPLLLIPQDRRALSWYAIGSCVAAVAGIVVARQVGGSFVEWTRTLEWFTMGGMYLPALWLVMRQPNEGPAPAWLERAVSRAPRWLRGSPTPITKTA